MAAPETPSALAASDSRRHHAALIAVRHAIADLQARGATVTFTAVAKTSGVARSWLYQQAEIRQLIGGLRQAGPPPARHDERASAESLHRITDALRLELARLRDENKALRDQLARQLGINRTHTTTTRPALGEDMSSPSSPGPTRTS